MKDLGNRNNGISTLQVMLKNLTLIGSKGDLLII
jgi:hypothetical protein